MSKFSHDGGRRRHQGYDNTSTLSSKTAVRAKKQKKKTAANVPCAQPEATGSTPEIVS